MSSAERSSRWSRPYWPPPAARKPRACRSPPPGPTADAPPRTPLGPSPRPGRSVRTAHRQSHDGGVILTVQRLERLAGRYRPICSATWNHGHSDLRRRRPAENLHTATRSNPRLRLHPDWPAPFPVPRKLGDRSLCERVGYVVCMYIEPRRGQIEDLATSSEEGPVVMINLLRYRPEGGEATYAQYGEAVLPCLARIGARVLWSGRPRSVVIGDDADLWDAVLLVEYPSRQAFLDMISSPEYQAIGGLRTQALTDSRLIACKQLAPV